MEFEHPNRFWHQQAEAAFEESIVVKQQIIAAHLLELIDIAKVIASTIRQGGTLFLCGNGGSFADAQHLAAELLIRLRPTMNRQALPALCLATDMSSVTACGNDYGFNDIFSRSLEGLGRKGDAILGITTSGKSPNVIKAFNQAKKMDIQTIGFLGCGGGAALEHCDVAFVVPSSITARIQESHITAGHVMMEMVEDMLEQAGYLKIKMAQDMIERSGQSINITHDDDCW